MLSVIRPYWIYQCRLCTHTVHAIPVLGVGQVGLPLHGGLTKEADLISMGDYDLCFLRPTRLLGTQPCSGCGIKLRPPNVATVCGVKSYKKTKM